MRRTPVSERVSISKTSPEPASLDRLASSRLDVDDLLAELDRQLVGVDDAAVIAQRFEARRFFKGRDERQPANLEQFRCGEEDHVDRKPVDGIDEDALLEDGVVEAGLLRGDGRGKSRGSGADDRDVPNLHCRLVCHTDLQRRDAGTPTKRGMGYQRRGSGRRDRIENTMVFTCLPRRHGASALSIRVRRYARSGHPVPKQPKNARKWLICR